VKRPFSNGTEERAWMANHCERCLHDAPFQSGIGPGCGLLLKNMLGKDVPEWLDTFPEQGPFHLGEHPTCIEFKPRGWRNPEPKPKPHPPGQDPMFEPPTGPLVYVDVADEARTVDA
jgi:hypothetical protein